MAASERELQGFANGGDRKRRVLRVLILCGGSVSKTAKLLTMAGDNRAVAESPASRNLQGGVGLHLRGRGLPWDC